VIGFELIRKSGLGRLGNLITTHGKVLTPELMPVYNPNIPLISTKEFIDEFNVQILITNAYIINNTYRLKKEAEIGIHKLIDFPRVIMLDSGAYQAWMYKKELSITNEYIIKFQEILEPDIATILDIFTDTDDYQVAKRGVIETIKRAKECVSIRDNNKKILWAAPIQGGKFIDLIKYSAAELSKLDFGYHPLGTLAPALMNYDYRPVLESIATAKINMNVGRPLHAFSIGHPMFFSVAVLFGSDLFDSSSYALYARGNRYITPTGTLNINEIVEFPCSCPICSRFTPKELNKLEKKERLRKLAKHNLYVCLAEMRNIRESIRRDKLWELVQSRVRAHPNLLDAYLYNLLKFQVKLEQNDPITKRTAFFYSGMDSLFRPEVIRYNLWLLERYTPPISTILIILPDIISRPIESILFKEWLKKIRKAINKNENLNWEDIHICILSPIFGLIPFELSDTYPFSQYVYPNIFLEDISNFILKNFLLYLRKFSKNYKFIFIFYPDEIIDTFKIYNYPKIKLNMIPNKFLAHHKIKVVNSIKTLQNLIKNL